MAMLAIPPLHVAGPADAAAVPEAEVKPISDRKPIVIRSRTMEADNPNGKAVFEGDVVAETEGGILHSDRMVVFYAEGSGRLARIESSGSVRLVREGRVIRADRAVYLEERREIEFTGNPKILEGENLVLGSRILYYPDADRLVVEDSRVYMEGQ